MDSARKDGEQVVVRYARPSTVSVDGVTHTYWTTALTVDDALSAAASGGRREAFGVPVPAARPQGLDLDVSTPKSVKIAADGRTRTVTTTAASIGGAARRAGRQSTATTRSRRGCRARDRRAQRRARPVSHQRATAAQSVAVRRPPARDLRPLRRAVPRRHLGQGGQPDRRLRRRRQERQGRRQEGRLEHAPHAPCRPGRRGRHQEAPGPTLERRLAAAASGGGGGNVGGGVDGLNWPALAQVRVRRQPARGQPGRLLRALPVQPGTWHALGGSGNPINASPAEQLYRAKLLYKQGGAGQWGCGAPPLRLNASRHDTLSGWTRRPRACSGRRTSRGSRRPWRVSPDQAARPELRHRRQHRAPDRARRRGVDRPTTSCSRSAPASAR